MKIVSAKEMARVERLAYDGGASEEDFMNRAGANIAEFLQQYVGQQHLKPYITFLCGRGNNGGDAFVAARILHEGGFHTSMYALAAFKESSPLCQLQSQRFTEAGGLIHYVKGCDELDFTKTSLIVDGILGTGFHGEVTGIYREAIECANASKLPIIAIDVPSGVDGNTGEIGGIAIQAERTLFLGMPKSGCFLGDSWNCTGRISIRDFGLEEQYLGQATADFILITNDIIRNWLPPVVRNQHKYQAGYVVGLGGSPGMPGAPIMSSFATLRTGAGIVRLLHPVGMEVELSSAPFEVIRQGYQLRDYETVLAAMERAGATFVGPGIGTSEEALEMLQNILPKLSKPCVIDAEALTLLAKHSIALPAQTVLTPHHGEMKRLLGVDEALSFSSLLEKCREYCEARNVTLVLKGAPTIIFHRGQTPYLCGRGDPGMATAGSGDILTGMIAAFLSQTHNPLHAAVLGVHVHALSGEISAANKGTRSLTATDIIHSIPDAFKELEHADEHF